MNKERKNIGLAILLIFSSLLVCLDRIFWQSSPDILINDKVNIQQSLMQIYHASTLIGIDIFAIGLGFLLQSSEDKSWSSAIKYWIYTIFVGTLGLLILTLFSREFSIVDLYNMLFPFVRNTYGILSGIVLGMLTLPLFNKGVKKYENIIKLSLLLVIIAPTIFNKDIFGFANGTVFGYILVNLGFYGNYIRSKLSVKKVVTRIILLLLTNIIVVSLMPEFSKAVHNDLSTAGRFTNSVSALLILLAFYIVLLVSKIKVNVKNGYVDFIIYTAWALLVISNNQTLLNKLIEYNRKTAQSVTRWILAKDIKEILWLMLIVILSNFIILGICKLIGISQKISNFYDIRADEELPQFFYRITNGIKSWIKAHRVYLATIAWGYFLAIFSFLMMNTKWTVAPNVDVKYNIFTYTIGVRQAMVLVNAIIFLLFLKFIFSLTNRYWFSTIVASLLWIIWVVANRIKIGIRNEPILPSELSMIKAWRSLLGMVDGWILLLVVSVIVITIPIIYFLEKKYRLPKQKWYSRVAWLIIIPVIFSSVTFLNHEKSVIHIISGGIGNDPTFYNQLAGAQKNRPTQQFLNNIDVEVMKKPSGYSKERMQQLKDKYRKVAADINKDRVNKFKDQVVIFNLSESFSDPNRVPGIQLSNDPIPYIRQLKQKTTSGTMISAGYGGGTANMEYMSLTGLDLSNFSPTLPTPYTQLVTHRKYNPNIAQSFPEAVAIHPYQGVYYSRTEVYKRFGFDRFYYLGSKYKIKYKKKIDRSPYLSDETAYKNALDQVKQANNGEFINLVTMQNHFPYDRNYYNNSDKYTPVGEGIDDYTRNAVQDFSTGLSYTDTAVKDFISKIDKLDKPVTLVFYGDHLPGIYGGVDMTKYGIQLHSTDYFIYSNKYAREHGARNLVSKTEYVGPNDFIALMAKQTNSKVNAYQALLTEVQEKLPVATLNTQKSTVNSYNTHTEFVDNNGKIVKYKSLSKKQKQLWEDYKLLQYDMTAGKNYWKNN